MRDQQHKGLAVFCRLAQPTIQLGHFHLICFYQTLLRIDLFPAIPNRTFGPQLLPLAQGF